MRWGEDKTVQFVKLYRELDCLWDVYNPDYKNKEIRLATLEHLVTELGIPDFTAKDACKKIRTLRSTFNQEIKKISDSMKCDSGSEQVYRPSSLKWFDDMNYIMNSSKGKVTVEELEQDQQFESLDGSSDLFVGDVIEEAIVFDSVPTPSTSRLMPTPTLKTNKRPRRNYQLSGDQESVTSATLYSPEDECDVIAKHIGMQLRQLPTSDMLQANVEIQQVLLKYRLANFDKLKSEK